MAIAFIISCGLKPDGESWGRGLRTDMCDDVGRFRRRYRLASLSLIRTSGIRPALEGTDGKEIKETVWGVADPAPGCSRNRCKGKRVVRRC